ncbi:DNA cytosine methyltransferase [Okeania sp. SIO3I5]|uniref:DNA cytosine methyltransferase n=1 Tax=Okeania sp. SIO3I5 TaxID=2607805 RepID=UPI0025DE21BE|nr:DNA cytosine methyltransferase [Okeania sp. SIO3I5]
MVNIVVILFLNKMLIERLKNIHWNQAPKIISLFSACGGMDLPFHYAGFNLVWAIDSNFYACKTFERNISNIIENNQIENINISQVPEADLITQK